MIYKKATKQDIPILCEIRKQQLIDEGIDPCIDIDDDLQRFFHDVFSNDTIVEYLAVDQDQVIATGAIIFYDYPPTYTNKNGRIGYITNMYTHPSYRKQGIASHMLSLLVDEAKQRHVSILRLGASTLGHPVYQKYGFEDDHVWMSMKLKAQD